MSVIDQVTSPLQSPWKELAKDPFIEKTMMAKFSDVDESIRRNVGNLSRSQENSMVPSKIIEAFMEIKGDLSIEMDIYSKAKKLATPVKKSSISKSVSIEKSLTLVRTKVAMMNRSKGYANFRPCRVQSLILRTRQCWILNH